MIEQLREKLDSGFSMLKEAADLSAEIGKNKEVEWKEVSELWEHYLSEFWHYIKKRSVESGHNLLKGISFLKLIGK